MREWYGIVLMAVAAVAGYAGLWMALPLGCLGLYFWVSAIASDHMKEKK